VYGKLRVGVKRVSHHGDIIERKLEVEDPEGRGGVQKTVSLMQLSSWPPGELPHPTAILSLVDLLTKAQRGSPGRHTVVMCRSAALAFSLHYYLGPFDYTLGCTSC
jgi:hypothetical protein